MGILREIVEKRKQRKFEREAFRLLSGRKKKAETDRPYLSRKVPKPHYGLADYLLSTRDVLASRLKHLKKKKKKEKAKVISVIVPKQPAVVMRVDDRPKVMTPSVERAYKFKEKEIKRYGKIYLGFMWVSLLLSVMALIKKDFFSYAIAILILVLDFLCYRQTLAPDQRKYAVYLLAWPFILTLNIASIIEVNILAFMLSIIAMLIATLTPTLMHRRVSAEKITRYIQEPSTVGVNVETDMDRLLSLLHKLGKMKLTEIAGTFDVSREKAEEWARIMEDNGFAYIRYPPFGEVELVLGKANGSKENGNEKVEPEEKK